MVVPEDNDARETVVPARLAPVHQWVTAPAAMADEPLPERWWFHWANEALGAAGVPKKPVVL